MPVWAFQSRSLPSTAGSTVPRVMRDTAWAYGAQAVTVVSAMVLPAAMVRLLSIGDYGTFRIFGSMVSLGAAMASLGLEAVALRYIPELLRVGQRKNTLALGAALIAPRVLAVVAIGFIANAASVRLLAWFGVAADFSHLFSLVIAILALQGTAGILKVAWLIAYSESYKANINSILFTIGTTVTYVAVLESGRPLRAVLVAWALWCGASLVHYLVEGLARFRGSRHSSTEPLQWRRYVRYGGFTLLASNVGYLRETFVGNLVVANQMGVEAAAVFAIASAVAVVITRINPAQSLKNVIYPLVIRRLGSPNRQPQTIAAAAQLLTKLSLFVAAPAALYVAVFSDAILELVFAPTYRAGATTLTLLALAVPFRSSIVRFGIVTYVKERSELHVVANLLGFLKLGLDVVLVRAMGMEGVALSSLLVSIATWVYYSRAIRSRLSVKLPVPYAEMWRFAINLGIFSAAALLLRVVVQGLAGLVLATVIAVAVYLLVMSLRRVFDDGERAILNRAFGRKIWVF